MSKSVESSTLLDNGSIAFIVEGDEIVASRGALMKKSEYFCNLVSKVDQEQVSDIFSNNKFSSGNTSLTSKMDNFKCIQTSVKFRSGSANGFS
jgi:hypothetical protein